MKEEVESFLTKADRSVHAAEILLREDNSEFAAGRAYYAMFYAAEALLNNRGMSFKRHSGVHGAFGEQFAKTSALNPKFHRWLLDAYDKRREADYGTDFSPNREEVEELIGRAKEFILACRTYLASTP